MADQLLFVGVLDYPPNVEAVSRFAREVLPRIRQRVPDATFNIVGRDPTAAVRRLADLPGVNVVGPVDDVTAQYARADVAVVPLALARGLQNKVLEALAHGLATVCSPQAAAGLDSLGREPAESTPLLLADGPDALADACVALLTDHRRRQRLGDLGLHHVRTHYNWHDRLAPLLDLLLADSRGATSQRHAA